MSTQPHFLSTSALAKVLGKEPREVFALLARAHWMVKVDGHWRLTEKGRFEGGIYQNHPKFGDYVAWPESVVGHSLWAGLPEAPLTASQLAQFFDLPARLVNLLLADLGWIKKAVKGWLLTDFGRLQGGQQQRAEDSCIPYVTWPEKVREVQELAQAVNWVKSQQDMSGRAYPSLRLANIAKWLYLQGFTFSRERQLSAAPGPVSFWLPGVALVVHCWPKAVGPGDVQQRMAMDDWLKRQRAIIVPEDLTEGIAALDEWLPGQLLLHDVGSYR